MSAAVAVTDIHSRHDSLMTLDCNMFYNFKVVELSSQLGSLFQLWFGCCVSEVK